MTIGIAAFGVEAGRAILDGLAAAERVARGAIGGFVSLSVLDRGGRVRRATTQVGGVEGLGTFSEDILGAPVAALMSSGPNRPEPLEQFVAAEAGVGLVTGHRFPNMPARSGVALNQEILDRMARGVLPAAAVRAVVAENQSVDAGVIAIGVDGKLGSADTRRLGRLLDRGSTKLGSRRTNALVAVRHNGIRPARGLALIVAEVALATLQGETLPDRWIELRAGVPVIAATADRIIVDVQGYATRLEVSAELGAGTGHIGMGCGVPVLCNNSHIGSAAYEPFLVVRDGVLVSIDGEPTAQVPIRLVKSFRDSAAIWLKHCEL